MAVSRHLVRTQWLWTGLISPIQNLCCLNPQWEIVQPPAVPPSMSLLWHWKPDLTYDMLCWNRKTGIVCVSMMASLSGLDRHNAFFFFFFVGRKLRETEQAEWTCHRDQVPLWWQHRSTDMEHREMEPILFRNTLLTSSLLFHHNILFIQPVCTFGFWGLKNTAAGCALFIPCKQARSKKVNIHKLCILGQRITEPNFTNVFARSAHPSPKNGEL